MGEERYQSLNQLQRRLPEGSLVDAAWLGERGYSAPLLHKYVRQGWLERLAHGLYRKPAGGPKGKVAALSWLDVVASLQGLMRSDLAVGGRTALELQGFAHYLGAGQPREIHLYGLRKPPGWLDRLDLPQSFVTHDLRRLFGPRPTAFVAGCIDFVAAEGAKWPLSCAQPERALLELLDEVPQRETFEQADRLVESLRALSPRRLQKLLEACTNVKVKRLCLWFAERHNHPWLQHIDARKIDLGSGKRMLARGGKLDRKYLITVPADLDAGA